MDEFARARIESLERTVDGHEHTIYGNGQPGLVADVASIKSAVSTIRELMGYAIGLLVAILAGTIIHFFTGK
jgi:hypothetical protein